MERLQTVDIQSASAWARFYFNLSGAILGRQFEIIRFHLQQEVGFGQIRAEGNKLEATLHNSSGVGVMAKTSS